MKITVKQKEGTPKEYTFNQAMSETGVFRSVIDKQVYAAFDGTSCIIVTESDLNFGTDSIENWKNDTFVKTTAKIVIEN